MEASTEQELEQRLAKLYADMDVIIDKFIDARAAALPGLHRGSIENSYLARARGCRCQEYKIIRKLITDEELRKQQSEIPA
jgi:hypothetical protein